MGREQGDRDIGTRVWGLGDARRGIRGHQVWDAGTSWTGTQGRQTQGRGEVKYRDARGPGTKGILDPRGILFEYLKQERVSWRAKVIFNSF